MKSFLSVQKTCVRSDEMTAMQVSRQTTAAFRSISGQLGIPPWATVRSISAVQACLGLQVDAVPSRANLG